ncbi:MAG: energy transducer TonB, partial [bacterium]
SILLHLLFLLILSLSYDFVFFSSKDTKLKQDEPPLVFEFEQPKKAREIVETPDDAKVEKPDKNAQLASDKNTLSRNLESDPNVKIGEAFSRGDLDIKDVYNRPGTDGEAGVLDKLANLKPNQETTPTEKPDETEKWAANVYPREFKREYLLDPKKVTKVGSGANKPRPQYDNQDSRSLDVTGFSLNTYEWEWAPYLLGVKHKVEPNIFPPAAYYRLGMITGQTLLRFKIMPDGELRDLKVLQYTGHETLKETSIQAINISAPFAPLPADFPEPYLEITAKFYYEIIK